MEQNAKPLSENDVLAEVEKLGELDAKLMNNIINESYRCIIAIVTGAKNDCKSLKDQIELDSVHRLIRIAPNEQVFVRVKDKVWGARFRILNKDIDYFLKKDYSDNIKKDGNQRLIEDLIVIIRDQFVNMPKKKQDYYWEKATLLLKNVHTFRKAVDAVKKKKLANAFHNQYIESSANKPHIK